MLDPVSMAFLTGALAAILVRVGSQAATDIIAQSQGQTPPSLEKWRARQAERAARGETPESDPGPWRRRWSNAAAARNAKAAQKHQARMDHLRDTAPENIAKQKAKLARRAQRAEKVGNAIGQIGGASWEAAKNAAAKAKDAAQERRAWKENERRGADPDQAADPGAAEQTITDPAPGLRAVEDGLDADVIPFRRPDPADTSTNDGKGDQLLAQPRIAGDELVTDYYDPRGWLVGTSSRPLSDGESADLTSRSVDELPSDARRPELDALEPEHQAALDQHWGTDAGPEAVGFDGAEQATDHPHTTTEGENMPSQPVEITDLDTAISYGQQTAKYTDDVGSTLDDSIAQITTAAEGLAAEAAQYEQAQASLSGEGFGEKVTGRFASAAEALQAAAEALKTSRDQIDSAKEQVSSAGSEMRSATKVFSDQQSVAESVAAAQQDAGVSKRTDFYAPA